MYTVPVHQVLPPEKLVISLVLMPEAVCCCLQTCKCGFDIEYQCTKSHSQER